MSRHRGLKQIIDEANDDEDYGEEPYYDDENALDEESEEILHEVWDIVGREDYEKDAILDALDEVDWDTNEAVNLILNNAKKFKKKKAQPKKQVSEVKKEEGKKEEPKKEAPKEIPQLEKAISTESSTKKSEDEENLNLDEVRAFRKHSHEYKPIDISQFIDRTKFNNPVTTISVPDQVKEYVNHSKNFFVVVCGHVDSGKSTLVGQMLYSLGEVDKNTMHKYEKESSQMGKGSFKFAWVMDEREEERSRGITIDIGMKQIEVDGRNIVFLDAPGHKEYVHNMIGGTAQADAGLLVVDSISGAFDAGFNKGGQTREHAILVRSMGIENVVVAVNKLDMVDWSMERFDFISNTMFAFLEEIGFKQENIHILPISGLHGDNVKEKSKRTQLGWYTGSPLLQILSTIKPSSKSLDKPFRVIISSAYNQTTGKTKGQCLAGKVESGFIEKGAKAVVMPSCVQITIKEIFVKDEKKPFAVPGESVIFVVTSQDFDFNTLRSGGIMCPKAYPTPVCTKFIAEIEVYDFERPLIRGERLVLHIGMAKISAVLTRINHIVNKETGEPLKKNPKQLLNFILMRRIISEGQLANVEIMCERGTCMELFKNYPLLGRVILREKTSTIAAGVVISMIEQ